MEHFMYEKTPELLLDKVAELNDIIIKHKIKNAGGDGLKFYEDLIKVMQLAFRYIKETEYLHSRNKILEGHIRLFAEENQRLHEQVELIKNISRAQQDGTLEQVIQSAAKYTEHVLQIREQIKSNQ